MPGENKRKIGRMREEKYLELNNPLTQRRIVIHIILHPYICDNSNYSNSDDGRNRPIRL